MLAAGAAAPVLAVGGITWAPTNGGEEPGAASCGASSGTAGSGGGSGSSGCGNGSGDTGGAGNKGGTGTGTGGDGGGNGGTATPPQQSARVGVTAVHGSYSGVCPPPGARAPSFTATFTVGRVPAEGAYRWVTGSGESSGPGWRTLSFGADEEKSKRVDHAELTYEEDGALHGGIGVEVRDPVRVTSNTVPFSVTCEQEAPAPTDGASYPVGGTADEQVRQRR
ncbi:hypothetical protein [Streptomyces sp. Wb2n-11]|uniref:hypothetical protein n=1 Tax=Streptomyces sp. Wb2n-11 TaxID=1030533 RepID=UPI000B2EA225|nr:hypothetical protein [Streptomyces sp. Wb2n-11]